LITKYGYDVVAVIAFITVVGSLSSWFMIDGRVVRYALMGILLLLLLFTLNFFRDPERVTPGGDGLVVAPADGEIVLIQNVRESEYLGGDGVQVSIFMSPLNVHVNRYPMSGRVGYYRHIPGEYLVAFDEKSSARNERTLIGLEQPGRRILFKQIAGFIARRIVADVRVGEEVVAGARFGMIKFGSRVDVIVPKGSAIQVQLGDKTVAGETVVAVLS
jgi:phosphatidylserine decarboxylase